VLELLDVEERTGLVDVRDVEQLDDLGDGSTSTVGRSPAEQG
jgi:hypothetical protein